MRTRVLSAACALLLGLIPLVGCDSDNDSEWQRVVCEVELMNGGAPLVAAYMVDGGDGIIGTDPMSGTSDDVFPFDQVAVAFRARPYSQTTMTIPEDDAYSSFIITGYNLIWHPGANVPAGLDLTQWNVSNAPLFVQVPVHDQAVSAVMVADRNLKEAIATALGVAYPTPWAADADFTASAELQFIGHDSGSKHETVIDAGIAVTFTFAVVDN